MRRRLKLNTVNVIEYYTDSDTVGIWSFINNKDGNKAADKKFVELFNRHNDFENEVVDDALADGFYETMDGNYKLFIAHSM